MKTLTTKRNYAYALAVGLGQYTTAEYQNPDEMFKVYGDEGVLAAIEADETIKKMIELRRQAEKVASDFRLETTTLEDEAEREKKREEANARLAEISTELLTLENTVGDDIIEVEFADPAFNVLFQLYARWGAGNKTSQSDRKPFLVNPKDFIALQKDLDKANQQPKEK